MLPVVLACGSSWALTRKRASAGRLGDLGGQVEDRLAHLGPGQGDHRLAGADHLPGLGVPGGDDAVEIGHQARVGKLVPGLLHRRFGLVEAGLAGLQAGPRIVQARLGGDAAGEQFFLAPGIGLGVDQLRLGAGQVALAGAQLVLLVGGVEGCQQRALPTKSPTSNRREAIRPLVRKPSTLS